MKKFTLTLLAIISFITVLTAGQVEKTYNFNQPVVGGSDGYQTINFEQSFLSGLPGEPILPYSAVSLLLPPGESAVKMEVIGYDETILQGKFSLAPQQNIQPLSKGVSGNFLKNDAVYSRNASYPANPAGKLMTSYLRGHSFGMSTFTPLRYNPATGEVSYFRKVKVVITTAPSVPAAQALANLRDDEDTRTLISRYASNPQMLNNYSVDHGKSADDYQILIITTNAFSNAFEGYRMSYLREGFRSQVVTTDVIANSMTGLDLQEKMRNYIIQEYQLHGIQHVVLAGDDELIPNRGFYCFVQSSSVYEDYGIPSDLYYSALDGNWNTDGDNMWAEPEEDDLLPEISIGRLSFSNSIELTNMLNKTYKYQFTPIAGEFQKVLMAGENLYNDPETWGSDYLELLIGSRSDNGYLTAGIPTPYAFNKMYDENTNWSSYDLINTLNQGYPMLNHVGHANETYAMKLSNWDITDANFNGLNGTTHNFTVIYTHGCLCGSFDFDDCIAEKMVSISNFAAAFVGNSRYGWFNEGQTEGPSAHLHREFMDALYTDKINRLGAAHSESKIATAPWVTAPGQWEPGAIRWCFYDCNVLGDPLMAVWTNNALNIVTIYPTSIPTGSCSINAGITCNGFGVAGLNCVVMQNGAMIGKSVTDVNGNTTIVFDSPLNDPGVAELVVSGYNCLPTPYTFTIDGNIGLNEPSRVNAITVYPNPVTDNLVVSYEHSSLESVSILLVSSDGKSRVIMEPAMVNAGKHNFSWDASDLASGIYQIKVITGNKTRVGSFIRK